MAQLLSVNVGLPREIEWKGKTVRTAVWEARGPGSTQGREVEHRRRCPGSVYRLTTSAVL